LLCLRCVAGLAFNFIASFTRDGGVVPVVETFKKGAGDPKAAVAKMVAAKAAPTNPIQAVGIATNNITYFSGQLQLSHLLGLFHCWPWLAASICIKASAPLGVRCRWSAAVNLAVT
jgi:hypothetical protein